MYVLIRIYFFDSRGNVPAGMILTSIPDIVKAYCKELIDVAGKDGGYIMAMGTIGFLN